MNEFLGIILFLIIVFSIFQYLFVFGGFLDGSYKNKKQLFFHLIPFVWVWFVFKEIVEKYKELE